MELFYSGHKISGVKTFLPAGLLLLAAASSANAAPMTLPLAIELPHIVHSLLASVAFGLVGIVMAIVGFKLFDWAIPFDLEKEMCQEKNVAVGILAAAIVLGICHIIVASMS